MKKKQRSSWQPDLPLFYIVILASLGLPRVVVHDLRLLPLDSLPYQLLAGIPLAIWLGIAVVRKTKRPLYDFLLLGIVFGLLLAITHQLLWDISWTNNTPHIGGNLAGKLDSVTESFLLRGAAFISSCITGVVFGAAFGLVAVISMRLRK